MEDMNLKDNLEVEVGKSEVRKNLAAVAARDKALKEAHDSYVSALEQARLEYVEAKQRITAEFEKKTGGG